MKLLAFSDWRTQSIELINEVVQSIHEFKVKSNDTSVLESKIDQMVYELYYSTEEEIKIVEESVN